MDSQKLQRIRNHLEELGAEDFPVVTLEWFFDGNDDELSIGPSLDPHPGVDTFFRVLLGIRDRPDVSDVMVEINDALLEQEGEWPFASSVYVVTTQSQDAVVAGWAADLRPNTPSSDPDDQEDWAEDPPAGAPPVPDGCRVATLDWD